MTAVVEEAVAATERLDRFEDFFHAEHGRLLRTLYLITGNPHEAEELAQEAFVRVYERWDSVSRMANPAGYVYRTALNLNRSRYRHLAVAARRLFALRVTQADPLASTEDRDAIRRALAALPAGQREAVVLMEWLGMNDAEAGAVLGVAPVTVRVRVSRARPRLQAMLRGE